MCGMRITKVVLEKYRTQWDSLKLYPLKLGHWDPIADALSEQSDSDKIEEGCDRRSNLRDPFSLA
jgi:hypothetical protein